MDGYPLTVTAASLGAFAGNQCERFLFLSSARSSSSVPRSAWEDAMLRKGYDWELRLCDVLAPKLVRLNNSSECWAMFLRTALEFATSDIEELFIYGLVFDFPVALFNQFGVRFGRCKPDFVRLQHVSGGSVCCTVIDAKHSKLIKASHVTQVEKKFLFFCF